MYKFNDFLPSYPCRLNIQGLFALISTYETLMGDILGYSSLVILNLGFVLEQPRELLKIVMGAGDTNGASRPIGTESLW